MSDNRINKTEVYNFLKSKKIAALELHLNGYNEKIKIEKVKYMEKILGKKDLTKLALETSKIAKDWSDIRDYVHFSYGLLSSISSYLNRVETKEDILNMIESCINWNKVEIIGKLIQEKTALRDKITHEYEKLDGMVKNTSTGNKAVRLLTEIGFDTSSIKSASPKSELMKMSVDNVLLGIKK